jgi:ABC-type Fe3+ transport system permease subunit
MRRSGWFIPVPALVLWLLCIGYPFFAALMSFGGSQSVELTMRSPGRLLLISVGWAAAVALGAVLVGWLPGRLLGRLAGRRAFAVVAMLLLAPVCLPAYVVFFAWWQTWPADSAVYRWAVTHDLIGAMRSMTLYLGLVCWSWPLVAWSVAGCTAAAPARLNEMLRLDGAGTAGRLKAAWATDAPGLLIGALIVAVITFGNTTCFDLAMIFTFSNELRALRAQGADVAAVLSAAAPASAFALVLAVVVWAVLQRRPAELTRRRTAPGPVLLTASGLIWALSVLVPFGMLIWNLDHAAGRGLAVQIGDFLSFYGQGVVNTVLVAFVAAIGAGCVAVGMAVLWQDHRSWARGLAHVLSVGWLLAAVVPAMVLIGALELAYNTPARLWPGGGNGLGLVSFELEPTVSEVIYRQPVILVLGLLARFGVVGALWGRWLSQREPRPLADQRRLDGAATLPGLLAACWPRLLVACAASLAIVLALGLSEIPIMGQLQPAGFEAIATSILNDLHYQRPQTVIVATLFFMIAALGAAAVVTLGTLVLRRGRPIVMRVMVGLCLTTLMLGCSQNDGPSTLQPEVVFGAPGRSLGQFSYPRGIAVDRQRELVYVVDKSARVQRFGFDGQPQMQWQMPEWEEGKPTGLNVMPDGRVFVADTHYFRVIGYDADGNELLRFGEYGEAPGQFVFPTDIVLGPQGRLYVSEYGGNDRVQVFTPQGEYLFQFGEYGPDVGQFDRPQSMVFNDDLTELFIADAVNHRIVVVDPEGTVLRTFGGFGRDLGQLAYPYDLMILDDGTLLVCEFGNNRLQRFASDGESLGMYGRHGVERGELKYPWGVDGVDDRIFVLDSGNDRVQRIEAP